MASWKDMPKTPTTTNESAAQGGESHNDPETETPEVPSGCSSMPETPALDRVPFCEPRSTLQMVTCHLFGGEI